MDIFKNLKKNKVERHSKKSIKKSTKKNESVDLYMKQINIELTKQDMYKQVNECAYPLLIPFQVIEKRGGDPSKNQVVDYSVTVG